MMIIKLTTDQNEEVYVNMDLALYFSSNGNRTQITFSSDNHYLNVKETPEEISDVLSRSFRIISGGRS